MPGIFSQPLQRREFLRITALGAMASLATPLLRGTDASGDLHLALLSDTHIPADRVNGHRGFVPWDNLKQVIPAVVASKPHGTLVNGDLARLEGLPGDYAEFKALMAPAAEIGPVYLALGNHDDRTHFSKTFEAPSGAPQKVSGKHTLVIEHPLVRIVILDSLLYVNKTAGLLGNAQRKWLAEFLSSHTDRPVVLFVHHTLEDNDGDLADAPRLFETLRAHKQVKAIVYGHSHVWGFKQQQGLHLINLPAVGYNFRDQDPVGWVSARFRKTGLDLTLHAIAGNKTDDGRNVALEWS